MSDEAYHRTIMCQRWLRSLMAFFTILYIGVFRPTRLPRFGTEPGDQLNTPLFTFENVYLHQITGGYVRKRY